MYNVFNIVFNFWDGLFTFLNNLFVGQLDVDLKTLTFEFYSNEISLYNYLVISFTIFTMLFIIYMTFKFFKMLYKVVSQLWY